MKSRYNKDELSYCRQAASQEVNMDSLFQVTNTHILLNGEKTTLDIAEIFDTQKYQHFCGVTYSASPRFMNKYLKDFQTLEIVIGIPEGNHQARARDEITRISYEKAIAAVLEDEAVKLFKDLSQDTRTAFQTKKFQMWSPTIGYVIHSKFYLLWNEDRSKTRVILGSANLSEQAFNNHYRQMEEILIFDDNASMFSALEKRFDDDLRPVTTAYFPEKIFKTTAKTEKKDGELVAEEVVLLSEKDLDQFRKEQLFNEIEDVQAKMSLGLLPQTVPAEIKELSELKEAVVQEKQRQTAITETVYSLSKEVISARSKETKFAAAKTIKKNITKKLAVKVTQAAARPNTPERPLMGSFPDQRDFASGRSGLFIHDGLDEKQTISFGKRATAEQIRFSLKTIHQLITNYEKYTINYEPEYGSRIFEAILYVFTAPFLYEIKSQGRNVEERHDIPQFLFLGGNSGSGKSSLLRILSKMTAISAKNLSFMDYDLIVQNDDYRRKSKIVNQLKDWMLEENVYPLLVDEIPNEFFSNDKYGEELVVAITNQEGQSSKASPAFIGTTNTDNYSLPERAARRSYYLRIDKPFDEELRPETNQAYNDLLELITTDLYQDFILRLAGKLSTEGTDWENYPKKGKVDFLHYARKVFKEYYEMLDQPLPIYFPTSRFDDSQESNQEKWRKLFLGSSHEDFHYNREFDRLIFKIVSLDENLPMRYSETKPSIIYRKALSPKVIHGSADGLDIELEASLFFEWIDIPNPYLKTSLFQKLKRRINE